MLMFQKEMMLPPYKRGLHLITELIVSEFEELKRIEVGMAQIFIKHTSASLTINENADPTVRSDFEKHLNVMVPENAPYFIHTYEGLDDMPAHIKASLMGSSVIIPVSKGSFNLGIWQGIYLCEHRNKAAGRHLIISAWGL
ncbi:secondary thiamine-phosphate synthase enzyme YjbQ [Muriicola sp.]|uniref:secondary thiamine-phosphate synthase enzyme YjbQ n=1 Tax=Muriicola sp. TaxID=2020856 RepID=UPI003C7822DA